MRSILRVLLPVVLAACGSTAATSEDGGAPDSGGPTDAHADGMADVHTHHPDARPDSRKESGPSCEPFQEVCGTAPHTFCASVEVDPNNCGSCGLQCATGTYCSGGSCGATCVGLTSVLCSGTCVDTQSDSQNCGSCAYACPAGKAWSAGRWGGRWAAGYLLCGSGADAYCAQTAVDPDNCGACGMACPLHESCSNGHCGTGSQDA